MRFAPDFEPDKAQEGVAQNPLTPFLDEFGIMILDGGLATELEHRGADLNHPLWSAKLLLDNPQLIQSVHYDYFAAGADVATTASYQATLQGLAHMGVGPDDAAALLHTSVQLAIAARDDYWSVPSRRAGRRRPIVAASVGPYGAYLADGSEYRGNYGLTTGDLIEFHRRRIEILATSGADMLALETIPCLDEAQALIELVDAYKVWAWLTFSCCDEENLCGGEPFHRAIELANQSPWIVATGINCTAPRLITPLLQHAAGATSKPLIVYPNRGDIWNAEKRVWLDNLREPDISSLASNWYSAGVRLVGGCCRTTPGTIRALSTTMRPYARSER